MKKTITYVITLVLVSTGCATHLKYDLEEVSIEGPGGSESEMTWYHAEKDPNLYHEPIPPNDLTPDQRKEYLVGYRSGWEDTLDDVPIYTVPGDARLYFLHCPGSVVFTNETDAIRRGEKDGSERARIDFNLFCIQLENKIRTQNQPSVRTR